MKLDLTADGGQIFFVLVDDNESVALLIPAHHPLAVTLVSWVSSCLSENGYDVSSSLLLRSLKGAYYA